MSTLGCLALIVAMEARNQALITQHYVASVAIERAKEEGTNICSSMKKPRAYSWLWDGKNTRVDKNSMTIATQVATKELQRQTLKGRLFFNEKRYKKRFDTPHKPIVSGDLIFY